MAKLTKLMFGEDLETLTLSQINKAIHDRRMAYDRNTSTSLGVALLREVNILKGRKEQLDKVRFKMRLFERGDAVWAGFSTGKVQNVIIDEFQMRGEKCWYRFGEVWLPDDHFYVTMDGAQTAANGMIRARWAATGREPLITAESLK